MDEDDFSTPTRGKGRPRKGDNPVLDYVELDNLLVHGEPAPSEDGKGVATLFPSYKQLAARFGISVAAVGDYATKHNCMGRRERARLRTLLRVEDKMVEARAEAIAVSKDHAVQIIDTFLLGFEKAIAEGRVRFDNPTDYNTMARLKEFLMGGADSRQEVNAAVSLDTLQARHRDAQRAFVEASAAERGEIERSTARRAAPAVLTATNAPTATNANEPPQRVE